MLVVDGDVLHPEVLQVLDLPVVDGLVEREAERVVGQEASSGSEAKGHGGVEALAEGNLGCAVLGDVDHEHEGHTADATFEEENKINDAIFKGKLCDVTMCRRFTWRGVFGVC